MENVRTLVCNQPGEFTWQNHELGALIPEHTLLKIRRIGICGTDIHAFDGTQPYFSYPRVLGHELAAEVVESSDTESFPAGKTVTIMPYLNCGECIACRAGKTNCCTKMQVFGVHKDGGMATYLQVPTRLVIDGHGLSIDELAVVEPLAIGAHGVRRAGVQPGEFVLVIGAGPIGLGTMEFAAIAGATVIALDVNENRLTYCREKLGITHTINAKEDVVRKLSEITKGDMPTVVIDCSGNLKAMNGAVDYMAHGARFVLIGLQKEPLVISHPEFHKREGTLMSSRNALPEDFSFVIEAIRNKRVNTGDYITHKIRFEEVPSLFQSLSAPDSGVIKALIEVS